MGVRCSLNQVAGGGELLVQKMAGQKRGEKRKGRAPKAMVLAGQEGEPGGGKLLVERARGVGAEEGISVDSPDERRG